MIKINYDELINNLKTANTEKMVIEVKNIFLKTYVSPLYAELKVTPDKKTFGQHVNNIKNEIDRIVQNKLDEVLLDADDEIPIPFNAHLDIPVYPRGAQHILNITINEIVDYFRSYNFELVSGNEVISAQHNFDALNMDKNHPAREMHDSFYIDPTYLLRTHCTGVSAIFLNKNRRDTDIRVFSYGNVYRRDEDDATHSHQFMQVDFVWLKPGLNMANLKYLISGLAKHLFGNELDVRYRLSYFPFTEPSLEVDVECWKCKGKGCSLCKSTGWIEILGSGMLNQNVITYAGIDNCKTGFAGGIGVERIAMLKYNITDIRDLYNNDFDVNKQFRG